MEQQLLTSGILHLCAGEGDKEFPKVVTLKGKEYTRLIGGIYLPCPTHELNLAQLQDVNRLRDLDFKKDDLEQKNDVLKKLVAEAVESCAEGREIRVVDVGCGTTTIASYFNKLARYVGVDIDPAVVAALQDKGVESCQLENMPSIRLEEQGLNAFIALYVLHFKIGGDFFSDIAKVMHDDDVMFANLYRIPDSRKQELKEQAEKAGLYVAPEVPDTKMSPGRQGFWAIAKKHRPADKLARRVKAGLAAMP